MENMKAFDKNQIQLAKKINPLLVEAELRSKGIGNIEIAKKLNRNKSRVTHAFDGAAPLFLLRIVRTYKLELNKFLRTE